ncbi:MAG: 5'/3'-nucleotidase SurE [Candidatus Latescibacterota bacterium]
MTGTVETWVLVTNDDGVDSPALEPLLRELSRANRVRAVVPAVECSWTGKIMSRFATLEARPVERGGMEVWAVSGYPADCANLGVHTLFGCSPALLVSGVNIGTNAGLAFLLSSGTVGAAMEGMLAGVPAAAFSVSLQAEEYSLWRRERALTPRMAQVLESAAVVAAQIATEVLRAGMPQGADMLNVNMPADTTVHTPRRFAGVTRTGYGAYFAPDGHGRYVYRLGGLQLRDTDERGDVPTLARGEVAMTPLRFELAVRPRAADRRRFEREGDPSPGFRAAPGPS